MDIRSWTWSQLALGTIGYWVLVIATWRYYTSRPAQQARARAEATTEILPGSRPGEQILTLSFPVDLTWPIATLLGPPLVLVAVRWLA